MNVTQNMILIRRRGQNTILKHIKKKSNSQLTFFNCLGKTKQKTLFFLIIFAGELYFIEKPQRTHFLLEPLIV